MNELIRNYYGKIPKFLWLVFGQGLLIHEVSTVDHTQRRTTVGRTPLDE